MSHELSAQTEQYLASIVAGGLFPSKEAALEAAVEALRNRTAIPMIPEEHMEAVEQGIASAIAGRAGPMTKADWEDLRNHAREKQTKSTMYAPDRGDWQAEQASPGTCRLSKMPQASFVRGV